MHGASRGEVSGTLEVTCKGSSGKGVAMFANRHDVDDLVRRLGWHSGWVVCGVQLASIAFFRAEAPLADSACAGFNS